MSYTLIHTNTHTHTQCPSPHAVIPIVIRQWSTIHTLAHTLTEAILEPGTVSA